MVQIVGEAPEIQNSQLLNLPLWQGVIKAVVKNFLKGLILVLKALAIVQKNWAKDRTSRPC